MPETARQSVVRNITQEWLPLILHFSFTTGSSFLFAPHLKLRYSLLSLGPLTCFARKLPAWIILMVKPFRLRREPTSFALLWSLQNFSFFVKTILASTPNSFHILEILQWLFWNSAVFYMSVDLCWREPHKDLLTPHGRISQNVLGRDNFLITPPNFTYEGIFQPLRLQWWE